MACPISQGGHNNERKSQIKTLADINAANTCIPEVSNNMQNHEHLPVVWCGENSNTFAIMGNLIALLFHFMAANDVVEVIQPQESICNIWTKLNTDASLAWRPAVLWLWVGPQQLTHQP